MKKQRKHHTAEEKVSILKRRLLENVAVSDLREELGHQLTVFYRCQKKFFENGAAAFDQKGGRNHQAEQERIDYLTKKSPNGARQYQRREKFWNAILPLVISYIAIGCASLLYVKRARRSCSRKEPQYYERERKAADHKC